MRPEHGQNQLYLFSALLNVVLTAPSSVVQTGLQRYQSVRKEEEFRVRQANFNSGHARKISWVGE